MKTFAALSFSLLASAQIAAAATFTSTFDTDAEGWTATGGTLSHLSTGGNPGGHLDIVDGVGTIMSIRRVFAPGAGLSLLDGGSFAFDFIEKVNPAANFADAGIVSLYSFNSGAVATQDLIPGDPGPVWQSYSAALTAADWGIGAPEWADFIADISEIRITVESGSTISEIVGVDNVSVDLAAPVPLPASLPLLALGGGVLAWLGRRSRRA